MDLKKVRDTGKYVMWSFIHYSLHQILFGWSKYR